MKKVLLAIDSFKGCLGSLEAAVAVEEGIKTVYPSCEVIKIPVADGGEGTAGALVFATGGIMKTVEVNDPLMRPIDASYGILGDGRTAVIEMSAAAGLPLISEKERNPMLTTTYGAGQLIADALAGGCTQFIVGLGGSATNDAGAGMLQALGYRFLDAEGELLGQGGRMLEKIAIVDGSSRNPLLDGTRFRVAYDVDIPFSGRHGAACIYAPQKGADREMVKKLDRGLEHFAGIVKEQLNRDMDSIAGSGSAGGAGGGLWAFLSAELRPGIGLVLDILRFDDLLAGADLVITGEGCMDVQTAMGKAPLGIAEAAARRNVPVIAITGNIKDAIVNDLGISGVFSIVPYPMSLREAMEPMCARRNIRRTVEQLFRWHCAMIC